MKVKIAIPIYLHGNPVNEAYDTVIRHYSKMPYDIHICGSEGELSRKFASKHLSEKVFYFEVSQKSFCQRSKGDDALRKKFNDSLATLGICDWYCLIGADDMVPQQTFDELVSLDSFKPIMAGVSSECPLYFFSKDCSIKVKLSYPALLLPGLNVFSKRAMQICEQRPYQLQGCETGAERYFFDAGTVVGLHGEVCTIKGDNVLNTIESIKSKHDWCDLSEYESNIIRKCYGLID